MSEYLDPVVVRVKADLGDTLVKLRAVRDAIKEIRGGTATIRIKENFDKGRVAIADAAKEVRNMERDTSRLKRTASGLASPWRNLFHDINKGVKDINGGFFRNVGGGIKGFFKNVKNGFKDVWKASKDVGKALGDVFKVMSGLGGEGMTVGKAFSQLGTSMVGVVAASAEMLPALIAIAAVVAGLILPVAALVSGLLAAAGALTAGALGVGALLAVGIPAVKSMMQGLRQVSAATQQYREASNNLNIALKTSKQDMAQYKTVLGEVDKPLQGAVKLLRDGNVQWQHLSKAQRRSVVALSENKQALKDMSPAMKQALTALLQQKAAWDNLTPSQRKFANSLSAVSKEWHKVQNAAKPVITLLLNDLAKLAKDVIPLLTPLINATGNAIHRLLQRADSFVRSEKFKEWVHKLTQEIPGVIREVGKFISKLAGLIGPLVTNKKNLQDLHNTFQTVITIIHGTITVIQTLDRWWNNLVNAARPVIHILSNISNWLGNVGRAANSAGQAVHNFITSLPGGHALGGILSFFGVGHNAKGTAGAPPGWAWVGEEGPELMKMAGGEQVVPHGPSVAAASAYAKGTPGAAEAFSGATPNINVYIDGKQLFSIMQGRTLKYNVNNNVRSRGRVTGTMAPH